MGGAGSTLSTTHMSLLFDLFRLAFIYLTLISISPIFLFLQLFRLFLITSLITATVHRWVRIKCGYGCGTERIDGTDMRIEDKTRSGYEDKTRSGYEDKMRSGYEDKTRMGCFFLCELSLNLFRKNVMVLDKTEFAAMFQLI